MCACQAQEHRLEGHFYLFRWQGIKKTSQGAIVLTGNGSVCVDWWSCRKSEIDGAKEERVDVGDGETSETWPILATQEDTPTTFVIIKMHLNSIFLSQNFTLTPLAPICKALIIDIGYHGQDSEKANK